MFKKGLGGPFHSRSCSWLGLVPAGKESLQLGAEGQTLVHVGLELGPLGHPLDGALLLAQHAGRLPQLGLVALQVALALALEEVELLDAALVQRDVFAHVGVEAEVGVGRQEGVQHRVHLWRGWRGGGGRRERKRQGVSLRFQKPGFP